MDLAIAVVSAAVHGNAKRPLPLAVIFLPPIFLPRPLGRYFLCPTGR